MNNLIPQVRIFPATQSHKEPPHSNPSSPQPPSTPPRRDTPVPASIEVGGDTPPPGPSGLRDGFEY